VADEIRQLGRRALPVVSDVSNPESIDALLARTIAEWGVWIF
jgi:3-oxoacyl-[acyl-carrier protein] reductase/meso-butanediol dehydrogenase/(S,S)-butanediol dehydrogenase/diacetyl reductase